jgi:hypothetical protein
VSSAENATSMHSRRPVVSRRPSPPTCCSHTAAARRPARDPMRTRPGVRRTRAPGRPTRRRGRSLLEWLADSDPPGGAGTGVGGASFVR